jgi:hypothetical protein
MSSQGISFDPATVIVTWGSGSYNTPTIVHPGFGYSPGDIFLYQGTLFGGNTPANDLNLTFTISPTGILSDPGRSGTPPDGSGSITLTLDNVRASKMNRDASDYTKMLKQRSIYLEKRANSPITNRQSADAWIPQGNQYRIDYLMGKVKCRACVGGAFNLSGAIGFNGVGS